MSQILVSVIVPVYNAGNCLLPCLESIAAQSWDMLDVVLVDDGSTDGSSQVCDEFCRRDPRFRTLHLSNGGPAAARQAGLEAARGAYLCFADADDLLARDMIARLLRAAQQHGAPVAACRYLRFSGHAPQEPPAELPERLLQGPAVLEALLREGHTLGWSLCNKLYQRSLFSGYSFPADIRHNEDLLANWQLLQGGRCLVLCGFTGYYYRQVSDSASHRAPTLQALQEEWTVAQLIRAEGPAAGLAACAEDFCYEKALYLYSMILRQPQRVPFAPLAQALRCEIRAGFGRALRSRSLPLWLKCSAVLSRWGGPLYRALCRRLLP